MARTPPPAERGVQVTAEQAAEVSAALAAEEQRVADLLEARLKAIEEGAKPKKPLKVTSAKDWKKPMHETFLRELPSGRVARLRRLPIVGELLAGTLPNRVIEQVVFGKTFEDNLTEDTLAKNTADFFLGLCNIAARAMVEPKFVMGREPKEDEVGPEDMMIRDLQEIRYYAVWEQLPEVGDAPFPPSGDDAGESGDTPPTGEPVRKEPK